MALIPWLLTVSKPKSKLVKASKLWNQNAKDNQVHTSVRTQAIANQQFSYFASVFFVQKSLSEFRSGGTLETTSVLALPSQIDFRSKKFLNFKIYLSSSLHNSGIQRRDQKASWGSPGARSNQTEVPLSCLRAPLSRCLGMVRN